MARGGSIMSVPAIIVKRRIKGLILSIVGFATAFLFLFPYVTMFSTALKPKGDITDIPPTYLSYKVAFRDQDIGLSAALAVGNFIVIFIFIMLFLRLSKWREADQS